MQQALPPLPLQAWEATKDTLHLWAQIVGKTRLALMPMRNHWWNVTLYPSARGLTTRRMPVEARNLEIEIDLVDHRLRCRTSESDAGFELHDGLSVADFHDHLTGALDALDVHVDIRAKPFGVPTTTPFAADRDHASYDGDAASRFLRVLQWSTDVLEEFTGWYCGKASPVHLFWHSFDLAVSRYSGRRAAVAPDADPVTAEAYSHEVISFGFWAGDRKYPFPAYYSYTAPEPPELAQQTLRPQSAGWQAQANGSLALVRYDDVRSSADPRAALLDFLQSAFEAGASLAGWDLAGTATRWCPVPLDRLVRLGVATRRESVEEAAEPPLSGASRREHGPAGSRESALEPTLTGKLVGAAGRTDTDGVTVWLAYRPVDGEATTVETVSDAEGRFAFDLPSERLRSAKVGAILEGVEPVDLEPKGAPLEPGELVLIVDDIVPSHLRYGGSA